MLKKGWRNAGRGPRAHLGSLLFWTHLGPIWGPIYLGPISGPLGPIWEGALTLFAVFLMRRYGYLSGEDLPLRVKPPYGGEEGVCVYSLVRI